ncbi:MAG: hypothetical protein KGJ36_01745 [Acidobacteriota bacterium]|nr:hypothetical protein [Acidobacteriota bacterium]
MTSPPEPVPSGWYPDPGGERQWRVWTGREWSSATRPYGERATPGAAVESLHLVTAVHRLVRYGVVAVFAGLGLLVSVAAHWPGSAHPMDAGVATTLLSAALAMLAIGVVTYALAGRELVGRWAPSLLVPGVNVLVVSTLVSSHLGERGALRRMGVDAALLALFVLQSGAHPYLAVIPAMVTFDLTTALERLGHQLVGLMPARPSAS